MHRRNYLGSVGTFNLLVIYSLFAYSRKFRKYKRGNYSWFPLAYSGKILKANTPHISFDYTPLSLSLDYLPLSSFSHAFWLPLLSLFFPENTKRQKTKNFVIASIYPSIIRHSIHLSIIRTCFIPRLFVTCFISRLSATFTELRRKNKWRYTFAHLCSLIK